MSEDRFISNTVEDFLVGVADSLREAQEAMNDAAPIDSFGRPVPSYQIPHLDFDLSLRLTSTSKKGGGNRYIFKPTDTKTGSSEVSSRITGRFIAIPPGEGLPLPVLSASITKTDNNVVRLDVIATNTAGEVLSGVVVELNFDQQASDALSEAAGVSAPNLNNAVSFSTAVPITNDAGEAQSTLTLSNTLRLKAVIVIRAEIGSESVLVAFSKETI